MKKYFKLFALTLIGAISFTACSNELEDNNGDISGAEKEIKIVADINGLSRTESADGSLTTTFVKNDEIGIFVYESDKAVYSNVKYVYNGTSWTSENAIKAKSGVQYKYYAYYPYNAEITDAAKVSVTVKADQTGGYNKEDFLTAQNTEAAAGAENITLNFNHAFSMVQVGIKAEATTDANASVTLENILPTAEVNVITGTVAAATGEATSVMMKKSATKMEYRAIVPAQTIAANAKLMSITADRKTFAVSNSEAVEYVKGQALQITVNNLNALPEGKAITIGGSIEHWEQGTDPGDGEIVEIPLIKPLENTLEELVSTTKGAQESWYKLVKDDAQRQKSEFAVIDDNETEWKKAVKLTYTPDVNTSKDNNSWYKAAICYNHAEPMYVTEDTYIYKVTAKIKSICDGASTPVVFTCKSKDHETIVEVVNSKGETQKVTRDQFTFFMGKNATTITSTVASFTPKAADTWETIEFYIDFTKVANNVVTAAGDPTPATEKDYNGFDLRIYTNNNQGKTPTIYVSDVTIEPYTVTK